MNEIKGSAHQVIVLQERTTAAGTSFGVGEAAEELGKAATKGSAAATAEQAGAKALTVLRSPVFKAAALGAATLGVIEGLNLMRPGREGSKPVLADAALGLGALGVVGLAAAHVAPRWSAATTLVQRAGLGAKVGLPVVAASVVLGGGAAHADVGPGDPFAAYGKEAGKAGFKPGEIIRSTEGVFTDNDAPKVDDFTDKGSVHSARGGSYADKPNYVLVKATGDGTTPTDDASSPKADSFVDAFSAEKGSKNSANYVIDRDGRIVNYVDPKDKALHTVGTGAENDEIGWNSASIGIALVNDNTGKQEYTFAQLNALRQLTQELSGEFEIPASHVLLSSHVAETGGPAGFPWLPWVNSLDSVMPLESVTNQDGSQGIPKLQGDDLSANAISGTTNAIAEEMAAKADEAAKAAQEQRNKTYDGDGDGKADDPSGKTEAPAVDPSELPQTFTEANRAASDPVPAPAGDPSKYDAEIAKQQDQLKELQELEKAAKTKVKVDAVFDKEAQIAKLEDERAAMIAEAAKLAEASGVDITEAIDTTAAKPKDDAKVPSDKATDTPGPTASEQSVTPTEAPTASAEPEPDPEPEGDPVSRAIADFKGLFEAPDASKPYDPAAFSATAAVTSGPSETAAATPADSGGNDFLTAFKNLFG